LSEKLPARTHVAEIVRDTDHSQDCGAGDEDDETDCVPAKREAKGRVQERRDGQRKKESGHDCEPAETRDPARVQLARGIGGVDDLAAQREVAHCRSQCERDRERDAEGDGDRHRAGHPTGRPERSTKDHWTRGCGQTSGHTGQEVSH